MRHFHLKFFKRRSIHRYIQILDIQTDLMNT